MKRGLGALVLVLLVGCIGPHERVAGTGDVVTGAREVPTFHRIDVEGTPEVHVTVGPRPLVTVEAQKNLLELIETTVSDGTLTIADKKDYRSDKPVIVRVTAPAIDAYSIHGASNATISGAKGAELAITIAGAGNVEATGRVDRLVLVCSGAGNADLHSLQTRNAVVKVTGVGNTHISVSDTLDVTIAGVGSVNYHGSPRIVHRSIAGVGNLSQD